LPPWLAPNLITLTGLSALLAAYLVTAAVAPAYNGPGPIPAWLPALCGAAELFYLHMDALDGKQARRTGTSSPLGQLFDHGCDALAVHLIMQMLMPALGLGHEWRAVAGTSYVLLPWWLAHWEEYHTGMMLYGNGLWGVTEACYAVVVVSFATAVAGPAAWARRPLGALLAPGAAAAAALPPRAAAALAGLRGYDFFLVGFFCLGANLFAQQVARVVRLAGSRQVAASTMPRREQGAKQLGRAAALSHLAQILATMGAGAALLLALPAGPPAQSRALFWTFGLNYALQATRLMLAHMSKQPFSVAPWPLALIAAQLANGRLQLVDAAALAQAVRALVALGYLHYVVSVVDEICAFFGIRALTIAPGAAAAPPAKAAAKGAPLTPRALRSARRSG
jgi:ethanolaminephosphotransferase